MEPEDVEPPHRLEEEVTTLKRTQKELKMEIKSLEERNVGLAMENNDLKVKNKSLMTKNTVLETRLRAVLNTVKCAMTEIEEDLDKQACVPNELYFPLLSLPGELRNQIYGHLDAKSYLGLESSLDLIRLGRSPAGMFLKVPRGYQGLISTNRQLHEEVLSYLLGRGNISVKVHYLEDLCRDFGPAKMQSIGTLTVNVLYAYHLSASDTASGAMNASFPGCSLDTISIAKHLLPICKEGILRRIVIKGGYPHTKVATMSHTMHPDEIVEQLQCMLHSEALSRHISVEEESEYYFTAYNPLLLRGYS